ncbi:unnamed protein product, partial [Laminaria digitata]
GGKSAAEWGPDSYGADEERAAALATAAGGRGGKSRGSGAVTAAAAKANGGPALAGREEGVPGGGGGGGDPQGYSHPSAASSYRAACDEFLSEEGGEGGAGSAERAGRFRFSEPKSGSGGVATGSSSPRGGAREDGVRVSGRAMAATV